jgi:PD-(D/E)XK nuclease superfamily
MSWVMPAGVSGKPDLVRLPASLLDRGGGSCAEFAALKARPKVVPDAGERRYAPWETFPLRLVSDVVDALEFDGAGAEDAIAQVINGSRSTVHPGLARWLRHAAFAYLAADARLAAGLAGEGIELAAQSRPRVVQHADGASVRMLTAWGRWYASADGAVREFRRLRYRRPRGTASDASTIALAYITASGRLVAGNPNRDLPVPVLADRGKPPARVRVVEVGLADAKETVLIDAHPEEIRRRYAGQVRPAAARMLDGADRIPGSDCANCKIKPSCAALARAPGLLGLMDHGTHHRTWSISAGRYYQVCPPQAHLRELRLPGDDPSNDGVRRGVAVHEWMAAAHSRAGHRACSASDLPEPGRCEPGVAALDDLEYRGARPYLLQHLAVCPLAGPGAVTDVAAERLVTAFDTTADVMVIARPDLLRRVDGRLVYRELKTAAAPRGITTSNALSLVPQLALAVCMIADGVFGDGPRTAGGHVAARVELEVLTPGSAEVISFDTAGAGVVTTARQVLTQLTSAWHGDTRFRATPGAWCAGCPVARWCPDATDPAAPTIIVDGVTIDARTGEVLSVPGGLTARAEAVAGVVCEPPADDEPGT